jgi:hypothetical protein
LQQLRHSIQGIIYISLFNTLKMKAAVFVSFVYNPKSNQKEATGFSTPIELIPVGSHQL